jgi:hypothetical protein
MPEVVPANVVGQFQSEMGRGVGVGTDVGNAAGVSDILGAFKEVGFAAAVKRCVDTRGKWKRELSVRNWTGIAGIGGAWSRVGAMDANILGAVKEVSDVVAHCDLIGRQGRIGKEREESG